MSSRSVTDSPTSTDHGTDLVPLAVVHAGLLVAGGAALSLDRPAQGWGVLLTVIAYVAALQVAARRSGRPDLAALAAFLVPVSVFQVLPDWVLAGLVGTLRFPDTGGLRVDDVIPVAMAGMWVAPLFIAVALAAGRPGRAAVLAVVVFLAAEIAAPMLGLWEPTGDTTRWAGVAIYVLPAEAALGWATAHAFRATRTSSVPTRIGAALAVSTFYLGALVLSFFLIDVAGWSITA
ncbi:DUF6989 domain-containing protein [Aeromicrobium fastidiosum]|uniref:DUF6989 domain-containing protein n=1 Tax=Aeromicrobium fastidiosum TaxID=52699 RepID=A0A641AM56_9ACTN|nr:hypothetical protein [Aeromicrobium fastidiosum]KAA1376004.1 hypothetical protein ESP62_011115 [Aeromicrobium fastidiosum]MBP2392133.1 hypothetical protein [Aeromicrobium fastidiosum]